MSSMLFDPDLARLVKADTLEPHQQKTQANFKTATDYYQRVMIKHPYLSDFHCRPELLHACLLEGEKKVTSYVPQPFRLWIGKTRYTPDCYVVEDFGPRRVLELKPRAEFPDDKKIPLIHFFAQYSMQFEVISNESVLKRQVEAENWLEIVTILHQARDLSTADAEYNVLEILHRGSCTLGDIVDPGNREFTYLNEIAIFRLLHRGTVHGELTGRPLDYDTGLALCA